MGLVKIGQTLGVSTSVVQRVTGAESTIEMNPTIACRWAMSHWAGSESRSGGEIDFEKAVWAAPAETMKMKRPHRVPLSRQAVVIFRELHGMTGQGEYVFPAVNSFRRPMSNNTLNAALRRLGYTKDEISVSGFRATASTLLSEMGRWNPDAIDGPERSPGARRGRDQKLH
jgi:hypothetical protein